jgi:hypothetical protein
MKFDLIRFNKLYMPDDAGDVATKEEEEENFDMFQRAMDEVAGEDDDADEGDEDSGDDDDDEADVDKDDVDKDEKDEEDTSTDDDKDIDEDESSEDEDEDEEKPTGTDADYTAFAKEFKENPIKAYRKWGTKLKLPNPTQVSQLFDSGQNGRDARILNRKEEIEKDLAQEFKLKKFVYKSQDEYTPKTPTYEFRRRMQDAEKEVDNEFAEVTARETQRQTKMLEQNKKDIKLIADSYFEGDSEQVKTILKEMAQKRSAVDAGKVDPSEDPLGLQNVLRGFKFKELMDIEVGKKLQAFVDMLNERGYQIPSLKELPVDSTELKGKKAPDEKEKKKNYRSPLEYEMENI